MGNTRRRQKPPRPEIEKAPKLIITKASPDADKKRPKRTRGRLNLTTSSKDYGGSLGLPEQISQRKYESTGQFLARLNRLVAQAKEEASMEAKFDMKLTENDQTDKKQKQTASSETTSTSKQRDSKNDKSHRNPRKKRRKR